MENKNYFNPSVTVDIVILTIQENILKTLLINRSNQPFKGSPALPGGFIKKGESSENAAKRILKDKAGVENVYIEQLYTFDDLKRDPRGQVISITYFAVVPFEKIKIKQDKNTENPYFESTSKLLRLAFDHAKIIEYAIDRLQSKLEYTNISYSLLPKSFTLSQLQSIYEAVLGKDIDKRNFRKKFLQLSLIEDTGKFYQNGPQRPAKLFTFKKKTPLSLKKFF
jgi:8-oxo-dGTP diphosphatase